MTAKVSIQLAFSTNCISAVLGLKPVYSGSVTRKPATEHTSASTRVRPGRSSRPTSNTISPATTGTKIDSVSQGRVEDTISLAIIYREGVVRGKGGSGR